MMRCRRSRPLDIIDRAVQYERVGRPRQFDTDAAVEAARDAFVRGGYRGTSIDDLLRATRLQRASLYSAFGSKRGLFITALARPACRAGEDLDLVLVALMDLASSDEEVRDLVADVLEPLGDQARTLGDRVLHRAGLAPAPEKGRNR
jgi:TetR/AcrR family transcriptional repressor of nem operon